MEGETIKVTIKSEAHAFPLETSPNESIAGVKVRVHVLVTAVQESVCWRGRRRYERVSN